MAGTGERPSVVVVGGGYGGSSAAKALDEFADVTLVERRDAFVHNVAALRALVEPDWVPRIFFPYDRLLANGRVLHDRAVGVDARPVTLASGAELTPDFIVLATGSTYPYPAKSGTDETATAVDRYRESHDELAQAGRVLIVGAGPTGLELAGEISDRWPEKQITILEPEPEILAGPYKQELRDEVRRQLRSAESSSCSVTRSPPSREPAGHLRAVRGLDAGRPHDRGGHLVSLLRARVRERLPARRPGEREARRRLGRGDPQLQVKGQSERLRARRRRRRRPQDGRPRRPPGRSRRRQHPRAHRGRRAPDATSRPRRRS